VNTEKYSVIYFEEDGFRRMGSTEAYLIAINNDKILSCFEIPDSKIEVLNEFVESETFDISLTQEVLNSLSFKVESSEELGSWNFNSSTIQNILFSSSPERHVESLNKNEAFSFFEDDFKMNTLVTAGMGHEGVCLGQYTLKA
jgi:hypothetical protein